MNHQKAYYSQWKREEETVLHRSFFHAAIPVPSFNRCVVIQHQQCLEYQSQMGPLTIVTKAEGIHLHSQLCQIPVEIRPTQKGLPCIEGLHQVDDLTSGEA